MVIDIDSSSPVHDITMAEGKAPKQMAPFPDMGMGLPDVNQVDMLIKDDPISSAPQVSAPQENEFNADLASAPVQMAPMPPMEEKSMMDDMDLTGGDANAELNFTNMEFTLAPTNNDTQNPSTTQDPSFDLTTFAPADSGDDLLPLDLLPQNLAEPATGNPPPAQQPAPDLLENSIEGNDSTFDDDMFGDGDTLDYQFAQLMDDRDDQPFTFMEHAVDEQFFGLGNENSNNGNSL